MTSLHAQILGDLNRKHMRPPRFLFRSRLSDTYALLLQCVISEEAEDCARDQELGILREELASPRLHSHDPTSTGQGC